MARSAPRSPAVTGCPSTEAGARLQAIELRGADEIVVGEPADGVRRVADAAVVVAELEVRVVVLGVGDVRDRVHEAHDPVEVLESVLALEPLAAGIEPPGGVELRERGRGLRRPERRDAALARHAAAFGERGLAAHGAGLRRAKRRST